MPKTLGERIRFVRLQQNISQKDLAKATEISSVAMYQIESGKYDPRVKHLEKIADKLNVSMDYLAGRTNEAHWLLELQPVG